MQIIVVGCGKVGMYLTRQLSEEGHNVTVIDIDDELVHRASTLYDVMGIVGNGTSYSVLKEADIEHTDLLIAVTYSDEVNILCCVIAKKTHCKTIARVRNHIYSEEQAIIQRELGIALIINPEKSAAHDVRHLLQFPSALEIDSFAGGSIELIRFKVTKDSSLIGVPLKDAGLRGNQILVCIAERDKQTFIPDGFFTAQVGDILSVISVAAHERTALQKIGVAPGKIKDVTIVGGGGMTYYLAQTLIDVGVNVKIIEKDRKRCEELSELIPEASLIYGDGISQDVFREENLAFADAIVAATGVDEENIIFSLYAKNNSSSKIITKVSHISYGSVIDSMELDSLINPLNIAAEHILQFVRALDNSLSSTAIESLYRLRGGDAEAIEFKIREFPSVFGEELKDLKIKKNTIVASIIRDGRLIIPGGSDKFCLGDSVIVVTTNRGFQTLEDILEK